MLNSRVGQSEIRGQIQGLDTQKFDDKFKSWIVRIRGQIEGLDGLIFVVKFKG